MFKLGYNANRFPNSLCQFILLPAMLEGPVDPDPHPLQSLDIVKLFNMGPTKWV